MICSTARNPQLPSATISVMLTRGQKALLRKDLFCVPISCFSSTNSTSPFPRGLGSRVSVGKSKSIPTTFEMGDGRVDGAAEFFWGSCAHCVHLAFYSSYTAEAFWLILLPAAGDSPESWSSQLHWQSPRWFCICETASS